MGIMKAQLLTLLALGCLIGTIFYVSNTNSASLRASNPVKNLKEFALFTEWISEHQKAYKNEDELLMRFGIWYNAHYEIENVNSQKLNYTFGHNQFSDLTEQEFTDRFLIENMLQYREEDALDAEYALPQLRNVNNPKSLNWTAKGKVTKVVNQGGCGSCWAFGGVASMEGVYAIKYKRTIKMSEQQIIDCTPRDCKGGWYSAVFNLYKEKKTRAVKDKKYPYIAKSNVDKDGNKICKKVRRIRKARTTGYVRVPAGDSNLENHAQKAVIAVAINVSPMSRYKSGVFDGACEVKVNHAVTLTGYGETKDGVQYWIIKNSWSPNWGDRGYAKLKKGVAGKGTCGISGWAEYPTLK